MPSGGLELERKGTGMQRKVKVFWDRSRDSEGRDGYDVHRDSTVSGERGPQQRPGYPLTDKILSNSLTTNRNSRTTLLQRQRAMRTYSIRGLGKTNGRLLEHS